MNAPASAERKANAQRIQNATKSRLSTFQSKQQKILRIHATKICIYDYITSMIGNENTHTP